MSKIDDPQEVQFRQVNPSWVDEGHPTRQAFSPSTKDYGCLSLDRSISITAKQSFENFTALGLKSEAVYGIAASEFGEEPNPIECHASPIEEDVYINPHHSHADFNGLSKGQRKAKITELRRVALSRGKLHP
jgi:hypothetical protein